MGPKARSRTQKRPHAHAKNALARAKHVRARETRERTQNAFARAKTHWRARTNALACAKHARASVFFLRARACPDHDVVPPSCRTGVYPTVAGVYPTGYGGLSNGIRKFIRRRAGVDPTGPEFTQRARSLSNGTGVYPTGPEFIQRGPEFIAIFPQTTWIWVCAD